VTAGLADLAKIMGVGVVFAVGVFVKGAVLQSPCGQKAALEVIPNVDGPSPAADIKVYYFCHIRPLTVGCRTVFRVRRDQVFVPSA
jgi:hypothetical protein